MSDDEIRGAIQAKADLIANGKPVKYCDAISPGRETRCALEPGHTGTHAADALEWPATPPPVAFDPTQAKPAHYVVTVGWQCPQCKDVSEVADPRVILAALGAQPLGVVCKACSAHIGLSSAVPPVLQSRPQPLPGGNAPLNRKERRALEVVRAR